MEPEGYITPKANKFLGYCPKCSGLVSSLDIVVGKKYVAECVSCHTRNRTSALTAKKVVPVSDAGFFDGKEYHEMLEENHIEPKKVIDDIPVDLRPTIEDESMD